MCYYPGMTKFYTRQGDRGTSKLGDKELSKDDPIFEALGNLDELNSWLGICQVGPKAGRPSRREKKLLKSLNIILGNIQEMLFIAQAEIAALGSGRGPRIKIAAGKVGDLERIIADVDAILPEITKFIIPGGSLLSAQLDYARTIARRVERGVRKYAKTKKVRPELFEFINRLSSVFFALARLVNYKLKIKEEHPSYK